MSTLHLRYTYSYTARDDTAAMAKDNPVDPRMMSVQPRIRYNTIGGVNGPLVILENVRASVYARLVSPSMLTMSRSNSQGSTKLSPLLFQMARSAQGRSWRPEVKSTVHVKQSISDSMIQVTRPSSKYEPEIGQTSKPADIQKGVRRNHRYRCQEGGLIHKAIPEKTWTYNCRPKSSSPVTT